MINRLVKYGLKNICWSTCLKIQISNSEACQILKWVNTVNVYFKFLTKETLTLKFLNLKQKDIEVLSLIYISN